MLKYAGVFIGQNNKAYKKLSLRQRRIVFIGRYYFFAVWFKLTDCAIARAVLIKAVLESR